MFRHAAPRRNGKPLILLCGLEIQPEANTLAGAYGDSVAARVLIFWRAGDIMVLSAYKRNGKKPCVDTAGNGPSPKCEDRIAISKCSDYLNVL